MSRVRDYHSTERVTRQTSCDVEERTTVGNVAFLGTGLLGGAMVERMLRQGDRVTVWNRTESNARALERFGAIVAPSPADAVAGADRVHMAFPDDAVVDAIVTSFAPRLQQGAVVADHSTTAPAATHDRLARAAQADMRFVHAPVFMSPQMCRDGVGLMMVSGPAAIFDTVQPALARMTGEVWYLGERFDLAACYKLFGNAMLLVINAGLADVLAMARSMSVPPQDAIGVFSRFNAGSAIPMRGQKMARGDFSATFELTMARKDIRLMIEAAAGQPLAALPAIARRMDDVIAAGHGKDDLAAIGAGRVPSRQSRELNGSTEHAL
jgi:3-hydroxyisobutyrate dehydrogenase